MHMITLLVLTIVLIACVLLSEIEPGNAASAERVTVSSWVLLLIHNAESIQLSLAGRYSNKFIDTGNGAGSGIYSAEVQS